MPLGKEKYRKMRVFNECFVSGVSAECRGPCRTHSGKGAACAKALRQEAWNAFYFPQEPA